MSRNTQILLLLALFALLASIPYLVPGTGFLILIAFIPLLAAEDIAFRTGMKRFWLWYFAAFAVWNAATTFWVCNATVGGGIFAVVANALRMTAVFALFRWSRKHLRGILPYLFLAALWVAFERFDLTWAKISWPWLLLGNAFARTTDWIQWYEFTGTLGGSLWAWAVNLSLFALLPLLTKEGREKVSARIRWSCTALALVLLFVPPVVSLCVMPAPGETAASDADSVNVLIAQPNINPYDKFGGMTQDLQVVELMSLFNKVPADSAYLLIGPETFVSGMYLNDLGMHPFYSTMSMFLARRPQANLLVGATTHRFYESKRRPTVTAREIPQTGWYDTYNSALRWNAFSNTEVYHKSKLVVGVESMPYPKILRPVDDLLGGVMGRCLGQKEVSVMHYQEFDSTGVVTREVPFGCAICYESVYGEYCAEYIRKGARFLTVITNDSWWGNTPGYRQHLSYSSLRAIETRRWIARCANTGISAIIDPSGRIVSQTPWWESTLLRGKVGLSDTQTFFVRHGDWIGRICLFMAVLLLLTTFVRSILDRKSSRK